MKRMAVALAACALVGCTNVDYSTYTPATVGITDWSKFKEDLSYCRGKVKDFDFPVTAGGIASSTLNEVKNQAPAAFLYPPALAIGGATGGLGVLFGNDANEKEKQVRMETICMSHLGIEHGYNVIDARQ
jgi:hypothetical protein